VARPIETLALGCGERDELEKILVHPRTTKRRQKRIQLVLSRAEGLSQEDTAKKVGISRVQVSYWEKRFQKRRIGALSDSPGRGRKPWLDQRVKRKILAAKAPRLSARSVARQLHVSPKTVLKLWKQSNLGELFPVREAFGTKPASRYSSGPRKLYWRSRSVSVSHSDLRSAISFLLNGSANENDAEDSLELVDHLCVFDTAAAPDLPNFLSQFAEIAGLRTTDEYEYRQWVHCWQPLLDIWSIFNHDNGGLNEVNDPVILKSDPEKVDTCFETATAIGLENDADRLLRKLGCSLPPVENLEEARGKVLKALEQVKNFRSSRRNLAVPVESTLAHLVNQYSPDYSDPLEARNALYAELQQLSEELEVVIARAAVNTAWSDLRVFKERLSSWLEQRSLTKREVWIEVVLDWIKLTSRRPNLASKAVSLRIEREVLAAADEAVRLEPGLRHSLGLGENELPSQIAYKLGSRVKGEKLSGPAKQIVRPLVSFVLPLKRLHRRRDSAKRKLSKKHRPEIVQNLDKSLDKNCPKNRANNRI
jgi:transposase